MRKDAKTAPANARASLFTDSIANYGIRVFSKIKFLFEYLLVLEAFSEVNCE